MDYDSKRRDMVEFQLKARGITDARVLKAMGEVPREEFVPSVFKEVAYEDCPLPIAENRTISQPYMVALMTEALALKGNERVLEIGAGSGYQAAILSRLAKQVYTIELDASIVKAAQNRLSKMTYLNVAVSVGDGNEGLPKHSPYDAIIVTAACRRVPDPLKSQLKEGGRMVIPVGERHSQVLFLLEKIDGDLVEKRMCDCAFIPLIGEYGWEE